MKLAAFFVPARILFPKTGRLGAVASLVTITAIPVIPQCGRRLLREGLIAEVLDRLPFLVDFRQGINSQLQV